MTQSDPPPPERADWLRHFREDGYLAVEHTLFPPERCESAITLARMRKRLNKVYRRSTEKLG